MSRIEPCRVFLTGSSAGGSAFAGTGAGTLGRGGFLSEQPALFGKPELCFGAEDRLPQLCGAGILCQNSGHFSGTGDGGNKQIVHGQTPLCGLSGWVVFVLSEDIIHAPHTSG